MLTLESVKTYDGPAKGGEKGVMGMQKQASLGSKPDMRCCTFQNITFVMVTETSKTIILVPPTHKVAIGYISKGLYNDYNFSK